jgi:simple sugar transport system permease protein
MPHDTLARWRSWSRSNIDIAALPFLLVLVVAVMALATHGRFLTAGNMGALASQLPELGLLSLAMMVTMLTAGINLSIISSANLVSVVMALTMTRLFPPAPGASALPAVVTAIVLGLALSLLLGLANGALVAYLGITPVLATLGTMILYEGLTLAITKGFVVSGLPDLYVGLSARAVLGIPLPLLGFAMAALALQVLLTRRPLGKHLQMIGSNLTATRFSAVDTRRVLVKTYVLSGLLCGLAGMIMLSRFNSANARQGSSLLLLTVLVAVLGGTDPNGGFGKVLGLVLALFILQCITSGLNLLGVVQFMTLALWGLLLVLVIAYRHHRTRKPHRRSTT